MATRGELSLKLEPVEAERLLNAAVKTASPKAAERGVSVHCVIEEGLPPVQADPQKIAWVLNQLLDNAVKFTPTSGRVIASASREGGNLVMFSIADTGIGIPPGRLDEVFEPFHQLDGSSTRHYGGTGLGLSLVRQIVEAHGSILDVQSVEGRGTTIRFPLIMMQEGK
jgi:signal transduction histidine kinase